MGPMGSGSKEKKALIVSVSRKIDSPKLPRLELVENDGYVKYIL